MAGIRAPTDSAGKPPSLMAESGGNGRARMRIAGRDMRELMFSRVRSLHEAGESAEAIRWPPDLVTAPCASGFGSRPYHRDSGWRRRRPLHRRSRPISAGDGPRDAPMFVLFWRKFANLASQAVSHDCTPFSPRGVGWMLARQHPNRAARHGTLLRLRRAVILGYW